MPRLDSTLRLAAHENYEIGIVCRLGTQTFIGNDGSMMHWWSS
jgi:hypothetical protein